MVPEVLLTAAFLLGAVLWRLDRRRLTRRFLDDVRTRALPVELAVWWQDRAGGRASERAAATRRALHRIEILAGPLGLDEAESYGVQLAVALPPGMLEEQEVVLPGATRRALAYRHARWDGSGIPADLAGAKIPVEAQLLAALDWLELRDGTPEHALAGMLKAEGGRRFSRALAGVIAERLGELRLTGFTEAAARFRVVDGALLCVTPEGLEHDPADRRQTILEAVYARVRAGVRPIDRVYLAETDVVVWLSGVDAEGAIAVRDRIAGLLQSLSISGVEVGHIGTAIGTALADTDGTSFTDLLAVARERSRRRAQQAG